MVQAKIKNVSLAVLFCFYTIFIFSIIPFMDEFPGMSFEVTDQNDEGVFSSLSRNFEQTIEDINSGDEKSSTADVSITPSESSNLVSSNSTTTDDLEKKNQSDFNK